MQRNTPRRQQTQIPPPTDSLPPEVLHLSPQEMEIAFAYFKKRFPDHTLDEVMFSLVQYVENTRQEFQPGETLHEPEGFHQEHQPFLNNRRTRITDCNRNQRERRENIPSLAFNNEKKLT